MRKAQGLARGRNRRKQQGGDGPAQPQQPQGPGGGGPANQQQHLQHPNGGGHPDGAPVGNGPMQRRKPSPEEQALTAKNYRLAKELVSVDFWVLSWVGVGFRRRATWRKRVPHCWGWSCRLDTVDLFSSHSDSVHRRDTIGSPNFHRSWDLMGGWFDWTVWQDGPALCSMACGDRKATSSIKCILI